MTSPRVADGRQTGAVTSLSAEASAMARQNAVSTRPGSGLIAMFDGWMGPLEPLAPVAPAQDVAGRQWDYPFGVNLTYGRPRSEQSESGISFATLRDFAEPARGGLDLLRLAIETCKDRLCTIPWTVQRLDGTEADGDAQIRKATELLKKPDGELDFTTWLRMLLEDHFVLDAVAVYPRERDGRILLELMDGATIKRVIDDKGRTPPVPFPAYQQILKGMPALDYTRNDLRYFALNRRTNRIYGMGRTEQVVNTVALALRRFLHVQEFYTSGSVPDMLVGVPDDWTPDQIKLFQNFFDSTLSGNTAERRKARFVPGGSSPVPLKAEILKDEFDEWLARVICFAFSLSPQALVKEMNRATAESADEQARQDGTEPMKLQVKGILDVLVQDVLGFPELQFVWNDEEITDPKTKAEVTVMATGGKPWMLPEEARKSYGLRVLTPEELEKLEPVAPPDPFGLGGGGGFGAPAKGSANGKGQPTNGTEEDDDEPAIEKVRRARRRSLHGYAG